MPPKKATSKGKSPSRKKAEPKPEHLADIDFVRSLSTECSSQDFHRLLDIFKTAREGKVKDLIVSAGEAIGRVCSSTDGLMMLKEAQAVEMLAKVASTPLEAGGKHTIVAVNGLCDGVVAWLDAVDPVDFPELSNVLYFTLWLGGVDEDVAVSSLLAIERFALFKASHAAGMLQAGVLEVLHGLLAVHRSPEFVEQVFAVIYLLCDLPAEVVAEPLADHVEIISTVAAALEEAPLNMRLQLRGLRLLALWKTRLKDDEEIVDMIRQAGAEDLLDGAVDKLRSAGFAHYASWISVVGERALRTKVTDEEAED